MGALPNWFSLHPVVTLNSLVIASGRANFIAGCQYMPPKLEYYQ